MQLDAIARIIFSSPLLPGPCCRPRLRPKPRLLREITSEYILLLDSFAHSAFHSASELPALLSRVALFMNQIIIINPRRGWRREPKLNMKSDLSEPQWRSAGEVRCCVQKSSKLDGDIGESRRKTKAFVVSSQSAPDRTSRFVVETVRQCLPVDAGQKLIACSVNSSSILTSLSPKSQLFPPLNQRSPSLNSSRNTAPRRENFFP